jgi:uncharacterized membrane protein (UPF0127 family)
MKKIFLPIVLFASVCFLFSGCTQKNNSIYIGDKKVDLIGIARTPDEQYLGLSFKQKICRDCGMLFAFPDTSEKTFVMRNMNFPLDIIFIEKNKIVKIYKNLQPEGAHPVNFYPSKKPIDKVLEVNGGFTDKYDIMENEIIIF